MNLTKTDKIIQQIIKLNYEWRDWTTNHKYRTVNYTNKGNSKIEQKFTRPNKK